MRKLLCMLTLFAMFALPPQYATAQDDSSPGGGPTITAPGMLRVEAIEFQKARTLADSVRVLQRSVLDPTIGDVLTAVITAVQTKPAANAPPKAWLNWLSGVFAALGVALGFVAGQYRRKS